MSNSFINMTSGDEVTLAYRNGAAYQAVVDHLRAWKVRVPKGWENGDIWKRIGPKTVAKIQTALGPAGQEMLDLRLLSLHCIFEYNRKAWARKELEGEHGESSIAYLREIIENADSMERLEEVQYSLEKLVGFFLRVKEGDCLKVG